MPAKKKWSQDVTEYSDALDLEQDVFTSDDPKEIAKSLKKSAEESHKRKSEPYRSAMSMLTFYINRAGKNLPARSAGRCSNRRKPNFDISSVAKTDGGSRRSPADHYPRISLSFSAALAARST